MKRVSITNNNVEMNRLILSSMLLALVGLGALYALVLGNVVFDIVSRKALEKEALSLSTEVGQLELAYLSTSAELDIQKSEAMGFREVTGTFATRKSLGYGGGSEGAKTLSYKVNEI